MSLSAGTHVGPYSITSVLGAGGMGEVYRARDSRLKRDVAIKVLPSSFAADPNRVTRLQREAEILASLNHPNIAQIYGLEETSGITGLVMELVEGATLADRLAHGPIPLDEALPIAKQIAEALEAAHEQGVIHRDLKPANIKVRDDGTVKVLDFGLAKAMEVTTDSPPGVSQSPTLMTPAMTGIGVILGTAAYMSPEQARGSRVEKRADVWSFGVVLYEMLAGRRLFDEATVPETLAAVLRSDVTLDALPRDTPSGVRNLIARCLTRDGRRRLRDIGEARIAIDDAIAGPGETTRSDASLAQTWPQPLWRRGLPWAIVCIALAMAAVMAWAPWRLAPTPAGVTRISFEFGADIGLASVNFSTVALSPDGRLMAVIGSARSGDRPSVYVRGLDQLEASLLLGTAGAKSPFFSPDSRWIGFFADGKLKKIAVRGGAPIALCDAPDDRGASWADEGWIAFSPRSGEFPLLRVSSDGGTPEPLTKLEAGEVTHRWPQVLPGSRAVLFTAHTATGNYEQANIVVQSLDSGRRVIVHRGGYFGRYMSTGHLSYMSQGTLFAAPFDVDRLEMTSQAVALLSDVASFPGTASAQFAVSENGTLFYVPGSGEASTAINWVGRDGKSAPLRATPALYNGLRFSPDGDRLATSIRSVQADIWVDEWKRDSFFPITSDESLDVDPVWTPDGRRIAFRSSRDGVDNLYWQRWDESGEPQRLTESKIPQTPMSWHPSGKFLAYSQIGPGTAEDIWVLPMSGDEASGWKPGTPSAFLAGPFKQFQAAFSPDGRWLAYQSNETGRGEVYVRPFPGPGSRWPVSTGGGSSPRWSRTGTELLFLTEDQRLMVAAYEAQGDSFRVEPPRAWADGPFAAFDIHPDGQRVAVLAATQSQSASRGGTVVLVFNVGEELRRLAPSDTR